MIPVRQRLIGLGAVEVTLDNLHLLGDCVKCAIASILERPYEDVPHFVVEAERSRRWMGAEIDRWLDAEGYPFRYRAWTLPRPAIGGPIETVDYPGWWLGLVRSKTLDANHMIVMHDSEVAFDPSINAGKAEYDALPFDFIGVGYFHVPDPASCPRTKPTLRGSVARVGHHARPHH